jgi:single-stranded-DNA-specific exonuclease
MLESKNRWLVDSNEDTTPVSIDLPISDLVKTLLAKRGINNNLTAEKFLSPKIEDLHDPFLFPDMRKTVNRIEEAIANQERVLVYGDYDADGVTSTALIVEVLREKGAVVDYYIPNRFTEGYGPNENAFRQAKEANISLIITVDNGIAGVNEARVAKELGIDLIITDHHEAQDELPDAFAIIHPKLASDYPFDELAGVGVAFKLAHAILGDVPQHLLELAAIGTVADLVTLQDENRVIVYYGLKEIERTKRAGLQSLKEVCSITNPVTEEHIGFGIGPRLNAVGRLQDASLAVDLLLEHDLDVANEIAAEIQSLNLERQKIVAEITKEAKEMIEANELDDSAVLVVAKEGWNPGVVGIVASKLVNHYSKPAIVLGIDEEKGIAKGSARSIDAFNLFENCMDIKEVFISFGGHSQAAGMTLSTENVDKLRSLLNDLALKQLTKEDFFPILKVDSCVDISELSLEIIQEVEKLAPFGMGNPKPIFQINESVPTEIRQIGSKLNHLKMNFSKDSVVLDAVGFGLGDLFPQISPKSKVSVVGELGINEWNGRKKMQIMLKDIKVDTWQLFDYRGSKHALKQLANMSSKVKISAIHFQPLDDDDTWMKENFHCIQLDSSTNVNDLSSETIVFLDLPTKIDDMISVLSQISSKQIFAYFKTNGQNFFSQIPTREHFKQFYAFMLKRGKLQIKQERFQFAKSKGWSIEFLDFIIKVFLELQFVTIDDGVLLYNQNPKKQDLTDSATYQLKQQQILVEKLLYYSSYEELKKWFDEHLCKNTLEEAVVHGL